MATFPMSSPATVMLQAINLILQGELHIPSVYLGSTQFQRSGNNSSTKNKQAIFANLTPRQTSVLEFIELGLSNKEIATQLSCAESTVKTHVSSILASVGVNSRGKLIAAYTAIKKLTP